MITEAIESDESAKVIEEQSKELNILGSCESVLAGPAKDKPEQKVTIGGSIPNNLLGGNGAPSHGTEAKSTDLGIGDCVIETEGCPCASREIVLQIPDVIDLDKALEQSKSVNNPGLPNANTKEAKIIRKAAAALGCDSELCVLTSSEVKSAIGNDVINKEIAVKFKETGPRNGNEWLSNINIDKTLHKWAVEFDDLYVYSFCMSDFYKTKGSLAVLKICDILDGKVPQKTAAGMITRPCKRMCCVLNTDVSSGRGIHWVCIFVDTIRNPISIEYFNSAGNPPFLNATKWMEQTRAELLKYIPHGDNLQDKVSLSEGKLYPAASSHSLLQRKNVETLSVTSVPHQESDSECGVYCLFYIRKRLEGTPYSYFMDKRIPDSEMTEFRKYLFRSH
jgi:hypothetical protein